MSDVKLQQSVSGGVGYRLLLTGSLILCAVLATGCATTATDNKPQAVNALAKSGNTYVVQRAAVRTPGTDRAQRSQRLAQQEKAFIQQQLQRESTRKSTRSSQAPRPLTKAQYHARYQAQKRAAARAAEARRLAEAKAIREGYIEKWRQQQREREQRNKAWQKEQLAKQQRAAMLVRKAQADRELQARIWAAKQAQLAQKKVVKPVSRKQAKPAVQKKVWRKPSAPKRVVAQQRPNPRAKYLARWERMQAEKRLEVKRAEQRVERVIHSAKKQIGRKYVWGGASPSQGFDCSGLVQHSISKGANVKVPRTALQQYRASVKVPADKAERGDLAFFITRGKRVSHVGIYLGGGKFVHAPRTGRTVSTDRLKGYWKKRFVGFGRIPGACRLPMARKS